MSHDLVNLPHTRHWRDIPQHVQSHAMSSAGRRRAAGEWLRVTWLTLATIALVLGGWEVVTALQENPKKMPEAAKAVPVKHFALKTDGKLDAAWLVAALALPKNASLMELDLQVLRARLLAQGQVSEATLTRSFPDTLEVRLAEREPVVRLRADVGAGGVRTLLVAKDGVVFDGVGYEPAMIAALPWLAGARLVRQDGRFLPIVGMYRVAELLDRAQRETPRQYETWQVVSLASLESDDQIEVRTKTGTTIVFGAKADFFPQIAKLDALQETLATAPSPVARINLALGREVPVSFAPAPTAPTAKKNYAIQLFPPNPKRELSN